MKGGNDTTNGLFFGLAATLLWGSYPLWYKPLAELNSYNLLAWRILFAEIFLVVLLFSTGSFKKFHEVWSKIKLKNILIVSIILGIWWLLYIYGIITGRVLEVAFGYFLSPVMSMVVSYLIFKEEVSKLQKAAIFLSITGVALMAVQMLRLNSFPWIALVIGFCYSFYGIFKKQVPGDPVIVQSLEIGVMVPFSAIFLLTVNIYGESYEFLQNPGKDILLIATGLITVLPLWWYSQAARKLSVLTLGFLQFIPPICNFLLATLVYHEAISWGKIAAFAFIWIALAIFTWDVFKKAKNPVHRL